MGYMRDDVRSLQASDLIAGEWHPSREAAKTAEVSAITTEKPRHNRAHAERRRDCGAR
jgi:hypothetical protein